MTIHQWWIRNKKVDKYINEAKRLLSSQDPNDVVYSLSLLNSTLSLSPRHELALELKARSLLYLRRFKDVAVLLHDYIPSAGIIDNVGASSEHLSRRLLLPSGDSLSHDNSSCFSKLKKKVMAGFRNNPKNQGHWRYLVLGQACYHLGLMEDAMILLQIGKRLFTADRRRESISFSDDSFIILSESQPPPQITESDNVSQLLTQTKLLLRRRTAALAALNANLYSESIRHFSKIIDSRRGSPPSFLTDCLIHRASAFKSAGNFADSISDCNLALSLDPSCLQALEMRSELFESIQCFSDSLHDLEHLRLLLRDRKSLITGRFNVRYREITGKLCVLTSKVKQLKVKIGNGDNNNIDYYTLMGIERGCSRSELNRAYLLLSLRHKPERILISIDRFDLTDEEDSVKNRARISSMLLYRLIQKGYNDVMSDIEKTAAVAIENRAVETLIGENKAVAVKKKKSLNVVRGVFCRDLAAVGSLIFRRRFKLTNSGLVVYY